MSAPLAGAAKNLINPLKLDGRPLYASALSTQESMALQEILKAKARNGTLFDPENAKAFVIWASGWICRTHRGGTRKWADIESALGITAAQHQWRLLTDVGLEGCRRQILVHNGMALRLTTLAREGGFPLAAIENESLWPKRYLSTLVGHLMPTSSPSLSQAVVIAEEFDYLVPVTWKSEELIWLSADLALAVVNLRHIADVEARSAGVKTSEWLERHIPDWKLKLPIAMETQAASILVDSLLHAPPVPHASNIGVRRIIRLKDGIWSPAMHFDLDGVIPQGYLPYSQGIDRMRMYPSGQFALYYTGELATIERDNDAGNWSARARRAELSIDCPLNAAIEVEFRQDAAVIARVSLPGGAALNDGPLLCTGSSEGGTGDVLSIIGTLSGRFKADPVFAILPEGWWATASEEDEAVDITEIRIFGSPLFVIKRGAILHSPDGDLHRVRAGQTGDMKDDLDLVGRHPRSMTAAKRDEVIFAGMPLIQLSEGASKRRPRDGELFIRDVGGLSWRLLPDQLAPGYYDLAWKDISTGHIRGKRRVTVLAADVSVSVKVRAARTTLDYIGVENLHISAPFVKQVSGTWSADTNLRQRAVAGILLWPLTTQAIRIEAAKEPAIAYWNDHYVPAGSTVSIADLKSLVACSDYPIDIIAQLYDRNKIPIPGGSLRWRVDRELPLSTIKDDIQFLLTSNPDIDGRIQLRFNTAFETYWYVDQFGERFIKVRRSLRIHASERSRTASIIGRCLADPFDEHVIGKVADISEHELLELPPTFSGLWLIYLRSGREIITRPEVQMGPGPDILASGILSEIMAPSDRWERRRLIDNMFITMRGGGEDAFRFTEALVNLAAGLNGLPPATFDILLRASESPDIMAMMAMNASMAKRPSVMALSDGLPFSWCTLPTVSWDLAATSLAQSLFESLGTLPQAPLIVGQEISTRRLAITSQNPGLASALGVRAQSTSAEKVVQAFLNRSADSLIAFEGFQFREQSRLPRWGFDGAFLPVVNAPAVAVLAATQSYSPDEIERRVIRSVSRLYPEYFAQAVNSFFQERIHGRW
ncbi:STY4851/ECs_5259 family protein [Rhizobium ruizarguesonis]|uniref:STY4851/ECs_5259 family protein n=1 Tax=Rhizobium ruizarguesonis TaxID=2081791 RepID=UPI0013DF553F|nr:STY4851/ECs_5259 family protein [Rhizobium ruizarguesonis]NEJ95411.1 hypothetical protein [Rhizobium ruizarguesonis]